MTLKLIIKSAWQSIHGYKKVYWATSLIIFLILLGLNVIEIPVIIIAHNARLIELVHGIMMILSICVLLPLTTASCMLALRHMRHETVQTADMYAYYVRRNVWNIFSIAVVSLILMTGISALLSLLNIAAKTAAESMVYFYLFIVAILLILTLQLMFTAYFSFIHTVDKELFFWKSYWHCHCRTWRHFGPLLVLLCLRIILTLANLLTLCIGSIWFAPFSRLMMANAYEYYFND